MDRKESDADTALSIASKNGDAAVVQTTAVSLTHTSFLSSERSPSSSRNTQLLRSDKVPLVSC